jgi:hypothetical protein
MTTDVTVRPTERSLPWSMIAAAGLRPSNWRRLPKSGKFIEDPAVTVIVKKINSRKINSPARSKPGTYDLIAPTTVIQFIAIAGGLRSSRTGKTSDHAERGREVRPFNYEASSRGRAGSEHLLAGRHRRGALSIDDPCVPRHLAVALLLLGIAPRTAGSDRQGPRDPSGGRSDERWRAGRLTSVLTVGVDGGIDENNQPIVTSAFDPSNPDGNGIPGVRR